MKSLKYIFVNIVQGLKGIHFVDSNSKHDKSADMNDFVKPNDEQHDNDDRCLICHVDVVEINEYFMLHDHIWLSVNPADEGKLCISCIETKLDRTLTPNDFLWCPLNLCNLFTGSDKLRQRLNTSGMLGALTELDLFTVTSGLVLAEIERREQIDKILTEHGEQTP
jgi:hypothetical protein